MEKMIYFMQLNMIKPKIEGPGYTSTQIHVPGLLLDG